MKRKEKTTGVGGGKRKEDQERERVAGWVPEPLFSGGAAGLPWGPPTPAARGCRPPARGLVPHVRGRWATTAPFVHSLVIAAPLRGHMVRWGPIHKDRPRGRRPQGRGRKGSQGAGLLQAGPQPALRGTGSGLEGDGAGRLPGDRFSWERGLATDVRPGSFRGEGVASAWAPDMVLKTQAVHCSCWSLLAIFKRSI